MSREFELLFKLQASLGPKFRDSFSQAKKATIELQENISKANKAAGDITGYKKTQLTLDTSIARQKQYKEELAALEAEQKKAGGSSTQLAAKIASKREQLERVNIKIKETSDSLSQYETRLKEAGVDTNNLSKESARLAEEVEKARTAQEKAAARMAAQERNNEAISKTKKELAGVIGVATAVGTALYAGPVKSAMTFESSMADVAKVVDGLRDSSGALTPEYAKMKSEILDLTKTIPMTANELTEIAAAAGQAGIARNEISKFTEDAAKMGIAFDVTADQAGDYMAKWRTSFGLTQEQVIELADKINYLGDTSAAQASQIAGVVTSVGPLGEVAGFASGEIAAMGATLIGVGVQEEVASTGIKKLMTTMTAGDSATKKQKEVLEKLGFSATEMAARMQTDAKGAVLDLMAAFQKLPEAEQAAALKNYFGQESIGALAPLLTNLDLLEEQFKKVGDKAKYAGSMQAEFESRSKTTENAIQLAKNALSRLSINIGSAFLPYVAQAANKAAEFTGKIAEFAEKNPKATKTIMAVVGGLLALRTAGLVGKLGILEVKKSIYGVVDTVDKLKKLNIAGGIGKVKGVLTSVGSGFAAVGKGLMGIVSSVGIVPIIIVAVIAGLVLLWTKCEWFREGVINIWNNIKEFTISTWSSIKEFFSGLWNGLSETWTTSWQAITAFLSELWTGFIGSVQGIWQAIKDFFSNIWTGISETWQATWLFISQSVMAILNGMGQQIGIVIGGITGVFQGLIQFITGVFTGNWASAWEGVKSIFASAFNALVGLAKAPINAVIGLVNKAIGALNGIKIPSWVPGVGGKGINIPKIATLWKGSAHAPDTFIAGEQGPELVMGGGGSKVFTAHTTKGIFTGLKESFISAKEMLTNFPKPSFAPAPGMAVAGAGGGINIHIDSHPAFYMMSGDTNEMQKIIAENNENIKREIKEEIADHEENIKRRRY